MTYVLVQTSCTEAYEIEQLTKSQQKTSLSHNYIIGQEEAATIALEAINKLNGSLNTSRNTTK